MGEKRRTEEKDKEEQQGQKPAKKRRRWGGCYKDGEKWGQQGLPQSVSAFLYDGGKSSKEDEKKKLKQTTINPLVKAKTGGEQPESRDGDPGEFCNQPGCF